MDPTIQRVSRGKLFMDSETLFEFEADVEPESDPLALDSKPNLDVKLEASEPEVDPLAIDVKDEIDESRTALQVLPTKSEDHETEPSQNTDPLFDPIKDLMFSCDGCSYKTYFESSLATHKLCHTVEKIVHRCSKCDFSSKNKWGLSIHWRMHVSEQQLFACSICCYTSKSNSALTNHKLLHSELKGFKCSHCDYRTQSKANLIVHLKKHPVGSSYVDNVRSESSATGGETAGRKKRRSPEKKYQCGHCDYRSSVKRTCNNHVRTHALKLDLDWTSDGRSAEVDPLALDVETDVDGLQPATRSPSLLYQLLMSSSNVSGMTNAPTLLQRTNELFISQAEESSAIDTKSEPEDTQDSQNIDIEDSLTTATSIEPLEEDLVDPIVADRDLFNLPVKSEHDTELSSEEFDHKPSQNADPLSESTRDMFSCHICSFKTHFKSSFASHNLRHSLEKYQVRPCFVFLTRCDSYSSSNTLPSTSKDDVHRTEPSQNVDPLNPVHPAKQPFACDICDYKCKSRKVFSLHQLKHTSGTSFNCSQCAYGTNCKYTFINHQTKHSEERPFTCHFCSYKCTNKGVLRTHIRRHVTEKKHKCECGYGSHTKREFDNHMRTHTGERPFACDVCPFRSVSRSRLFAHKQTHSKGNNDDDSNAVRSVTSKPLSRQHQKSASSNKPGYRGLKLKCSKCKYRTFKREMLTVHVRMHSVEHSFACDHCSYTTFTNRALASHNKRHTREKRYTCIECGYRSGSLSDLDIHMKLHPGVLAYDCDVCSEKCSSSRNLFLHKRLHTTSEKKEKKEKKEIKGKKYFKCSQCEYRSYYKQSIVVHVLMHTGEKPYACDGCSYKSRSSKYLRLHKRKYH